MAKAKTRSQKQSEERAKRRLIIYNTWGDKKLANQAKNWSKERIYFELGIKVDTVKRKPKERKFTERGVKQLERRLKSYQAGIRYQFRTYGNYDIEQVKRYSKVGYKEKKTIRLIDAKVQANLPFENKQEHIPMNVQKRGRTDLWSDWDKKDNLYPLELTNWARLINRRNGYDKDANFGWVVVYFAYVNFDKPEKWEKRIKERVLDKDGNIYRKFVKI